MTRDKFDRWFYEQFRYWFASAFSKEFERWHDTKPSGWPGGDDSVASHNDWEARIKRLEQFHCEHEFSKRDKGCLESIFCAKCGALHPDWRKLGKRTYFFSADDEPAERLYIDGVEYCTKAVRPKKGKK